MLLSNYVWFLISVSKFESWPVVIYWSVTVAIATEQKFRRHGLMRHRCCVHLIHLPNYELGPTLFKIANTISLFEVWWDQNVMVYVNWVIFFQLNGFPITQLEVPPLLLFCHSFENANTLILGFDEKSICTEEFSSHNAM